MGAIEWVCTNPVVCVLGVLTDFVSVGMVCGLADAVAAVALALLWLGLGIGWCLVVEERRFWLAPYSAGYSLGWWRFGALSGMVGDCAGSGDRHQFPSVDSGARLGG